MPASEPLLEAVPFSALYVVTAGWEGGVSRKAFERVGRLKPIRMRRPATMLADMAAGAAQRDRAVVVHTRDRGCAITWAVAPIGRPWPPEACLLLARPARRPFAAEELESVARAAAEMELPLWEEEAAAARALLLHGQTLRRGLEEQLVEAREARGWVESAHRELQRAFHELSAQKQELEASSRWRVAAHQELQAAFEELELANEAKNRFLANVSHELKTPLTSISAFTDILARNRSGNLKERELKHLAVMRRNGRRLGVLINDLLDLSRIDSGSIDLHLGEFSISDLLRGMAEMFDPLLTERGQRLLVDDESDGAWIRADRQRLEQLITNLVTNASKFSPDGSAITLRATANGDRLEMAVVDPGVGIPRDAQARIFDAFFRVENEETRAVPGTGVGLHIAAAIVHMHDGEISVHSEPGAGTTFVVILPDVRSGPTSAFLAAEAARKRAPEVRSRLDDPDQKRAA